MSNQKKSKKLEYFRGPDEQDAEAREVEQAERHASEEVIHQHVTEIWGYVRNHADSLDADKHCRKITEVVTRLVKHMQKRIESLSLEQHRDRKKLATRDKQLRAAKAQPEKPKKKADIVAPTGSNLATYVKTLKTSPPTLKHKDIL